MSKEIPKLCYVDEPWAYFTTQTLSEQWGDDWNDAPYEHNAEPPYQFNEHDAKEGKKSWKIIKVAYDGSLSTPCEGQLNSRYSVEQINKGAVAWLRDEWGKSGIVIPAGTSLEDFKAAIKRAGGKVYESV